MIYLQDQLKIGTLPAELSHIYLRNFGHFIMYDKPSGENFVNFFFDQHYTPPQNLDILRYGNNIIWSTSTLNTQGFILLDVSFMRSLKRYYCNKIVNSLTSFAVRVVSRSKITGTLGKAYFRSESQEISISEHRKCINMPFDKNKFGDHDF